MTPFLPLPRAGLGSPEGTPAGFRCPFVKFLALNVFYGEPGFTGVPRSCENAHPPRTPIGPQA